MKKTILLLISLFLCAIVCSADRYEVFRLSGTVKLLKDGEWVTAKKYEPLQSTTKMMLGTNSFVGIKDNKTKKIYYSSTAGENMVSAIIIAAKKQSKSTTSLLTGALNDAAGNGHEKAGRGKSPRISGVINRGGGFSNNGNEIGALPCSGTSFGNTINGLLSGKAECTAPDSLGMKLALIVEPEDSVLSYTITALGPAADTVFVNVVRIAEGEAPQLLFDGGVDGGNISITKDSELKVDWYPSVYSPSAKYLLIVCEKDFSPNITQSMLDRSFKSKMTGISRPAYIDNALWNAGTWLVEANL